MVPIDATHLVLWGQYIGRGHPSLTLCDEVKNILRRVALDEGRNRFRGTRRLG